MRAAIFNGPGSITVGSRPHPFIKESTDAVVRVVLACICGSDLWYYRGESDHAVGSIAHAGSVGPERTTAPTCPGGDQTTRRGHQTPSVLRAPICSSPFATRRASRLSP